MCVMMMYLAAMVCAAQSKASDYQPGTVMAVQPRKAADDNGPRDYEVTLRIGTNEYVVLVEPRGSSTVEYSEGQEHLFKVGKKTIAFRDMLGRYWEWPILRSRVVQEKKPG
jgi:hypothetical protein